MGQHRRSAISMDGRPAVGLCSLARNQPGHRARHKGGPTMTHLRSCLIALLTVAALALGGQREATAGRCKADGEVCRTDQSCCGTSGNNGVCVKEPGQKFGTCCTPVGCAGKQCGDDCGTSCGTCGTGYACGCSGGVCGICQELFTCTMTCVDGSIVNVGQCNLSGSACALGCTAQRCNVDCNLNFGVGCSSAACNSCVP